MKPTLTIGGKPADDPARLTARPRLFDVKPDLTPVRVPRLTTFPSQQAAVDELGKLVGEIDGLRMAIAETEARIGRLQGRLADPALFDHPKRGEAAARHEDLVLERNRQRGRLDATVMVIAKTYCALARETRDELMTTGWAPSETPEQVRAWLESCLAVGWLPHKEVPW